MVDGSLVELPELQCEVVARSEPTLLDLRSVIAAGGIGGHAKVEPKVSSSSSGMAIAVAIALPLCVIGLGTSQTDWSLSLGAPLLYLTNLSISRLDPLSVCSPRVRSK